MELRFSFVLLAAALAAAAQTDMPRVNLDVIAVDDHGAPVTDLTQDDFQVTDAGTPQKIVFFRHNDSRLRPGVALASNEFSNRRRGNVERATVILFDLLNERLGTRGAASNQLVHYLETIESANSLYLYLLTLDGRLYSVHGLPDVESGAPQDGAAPWTRDARQLLDEALREVNRIRVPADNIAVRAGWTFQALEGLGNSLSVIPGRKNIVWITDGVPITIGTAAPYFVDFTPRLQRLGANLGRSGIAIYPVRQRLGLSDLGNQQTLSQLAGLTGGRPDEGKDIEAAAKQAMSDLQTSYQIGYYPPARNWDGKFHKLRVTCARKGVRIQTKSGYYAFPEPPEARARAAFGAAAATHFDTAGIGLRATLTPDVNDGHSARLAAFIDANDVAVTHDRDQYRGELRMGLAIYRGDAPAEITVTDPVAIRLSATEFERVSKDGLALTKDVMIGDGIRQIRLMVFDVASGAIGSLTIPVPAK
jgi:VWFA-related protein